MESKKTANPLSEQLCKIERELKAIWQLLSPSEKQNRTVLHKMNRLQMTLHRLKFSQGMGYQNQALGEKN